MPDAQNQKDTLMQFNEMSDLVVTHFIFFLDIEMFFFSQKKFAFYWQSEDFKKTIMIVLNAFF